jgi:hypothetical protein
VVVTENFDGTWPPSGWTFNGANRSSPAYSGAYSLELQPAGDYAYTRKVNTPGLITFFALENTGSQYSFKIQCSTDTTNWTDITTYSNSSNSLTRSFKFYSVDVHAATYTNVYFRFYLASGNGDIHIDDVNITLRSPNTQASNVTFSDIGPSRFTVSCTAGSAAQRIMFMKEGNVSPLMQTMVFFIQPALIGMIRVPKLVQPDFIVSIEALEQVLLLQVLLKVLLTLWK